MSYTVRIDDEQRYGDDYQVLRIERDGKVLEEHGDRGEPEDNSYYRDWSWVQGALEKAYAFGLEDGRGSSLDVKLDAQRNAALEAAALIADRTPAADRVRHEIADKIRALKGAQMKGNAG